jgi:hypothetical protein
VLTLTNPRLEGEELTYNVDVLDGKLPDATGPCSLFIDPVAGHSLDEAHRTCR